MKHFLFTVLSLLFVLPAFAQNPTSPEEEAKKLRESIDKEVERLTELLDLADWQIFYVDSTLSYNMESMVAEQKGLQAAKVGNSDLYMLTADKWWDATDRQYRSIFDETQWKRYMKSGGEKARKAREKRAAKAEKATMETKNKK